MKKKPVKGKKRLSSALVSQATLITSQAELDAALASCTPIVVNISMLLDFACNKRGHLRHNAGLRPLRRPEEGRDLPLYTGSQLHAAVDLLVSGQVPESELRTMVADDYAALHTEAKEAGAPVEVLAKIERDAGWLLDAMPFLARKLATLEALGELTLTSERVFGLLWRFENDPFFEDACVLVVGIPDQFTIFNGGFYHRQVKSIGEQRARWGRDAYKLRIQRSLHEAFYGAVGTKLSERASLPRYRGTLLDLWCKEDRPKTSEEIRESRPLNTFCCEKCGFGLRHFRLAAMKAEHPRKRNCEGDAKTIIEKRDAWLSRIANAANEIAQWEHRLFDRTMLLIDGDAMEMAIEQILLLALRTNELRSSNPFDPAYRHLRGFAWMNEGECDKYAGCEFRRQCKRAGLEIYDETTGFERRVEGYVADVAAGEWPAVVTDAFSELEEGE